MSNDILEILQIDKSSENKRVVNTAKNRQIGLIVAIFGIALIIVSQTQEFTKTRTFDAGYGFTDTDVREDKATKNLILYSGIIALIVGGIVFGAGFKTTSDSTKPLQNFSPSNKTQDDAIQQLEKLDALRQKGIITEEEFSTKKTELLLKL